MSHIVRLPCALIVVAFVCTGIRKIVLEVRSRSATLNAMKTIKSALRSRWALLVIPVAVIYSYPLSVGAYGEVSANAGWLRLPLVGAGISAIAVFALPALWATNKKHVPIPDTVKWLVLSNYALLVVLLGYSEFSRSKPNGELTGFTEQAAITIAGLFFATYVAALIGCDTQARKRVLTIGKAPVLAAQKFATRLRGRASFSQIWEKNFYPSI